jgi:Family of unknown function (DUF5678)
MATLEEILDEARKLPVNEQRRLREALGEVASNGKERHSYQTHEKERAWVEAHRDEFLDQWVALDGDNLIAHGTDARTVYDQARANGSESPYLVHVVPQVDAYVGGW